MTGPPPQAALSGEQYQDDPNIPDNAKLLRRIPGGRFTEKAGARVPNSDCFKNSSDGTGTSIDIWEDDWSPQKCLEGQAEGFGVVAVTAGQLRGLGIGVIRAPLPDNPHHALLQGPKGKKTLKKLAKLCEWEIMPSEIPPEQRGA